MVSTLFSSSPFNPSTTTSAPRPKMSITQTYFLAHKARAKLSSEAARPDHNLRLLVGHANLLDSLMLDLAEAEREQESWFNQSVRNSSTTSKSADRHVQWADDIVEEDWEADSSDSDSDFDDEEEEEDTDIEMVDAAPLRRMVPASPQVHTIELDEEDDDEEDYESLALTRTPSHIASPPELDLDSDSSEDESMPPSPPTASFPVFSSQGASQKPRETTVTETPLFDSQDEDEEQDITDSHHNKSSFYQDGFYLPSRNPARLVSTISVY